MVTKKKILVTAGSTNAPIDQVRCISNIFKGKTGTQIAEYLGEYHDVTLITSNTGIITNKFRLQKTIPFKTFDDLLQPMQAEITDGNYDAIVHSAAVSDYKVKDVCVDDGSGKVVPVDSSKKVSSDHKDIYLHLVQTEKIIDLIRSPWGFEGYLVKFKLQVGISDEELIEIALRSMKVSQADMIVANCLEWSRERAYVITESLTEPVVREAISSRIHQALQRRWNI